MVTKDTKVISFRGDLDFDVKIVRPQQQDHVNQEGNGNVEEMDTKSIIIDISDQTPDNDATTEQVAVENQPIC